MLTVLGFLVSISVLVWWSLWQRRAPGEAWVPFEPRRPVPWGLLDLALIVAALLAVSTLVAAAVQQSGRTAAGDVDLPRLSAAFDERTVWAQAAVFLLVFAVSAVSLSLRYRVTARDLGIVASRMGHDVRLGAVAFLALGPPTYALQMLLVRRFESKHPLIELLREQPRPGLIAATLVTAVVVAPLTEEYFFRGLLQGWLERLASGTGAGRHLILGGPPLPPPADEEATEATPADGADPSCASVSPPPVDDSQARAPAEEAENGSLSVASFPSQTPPSPSAGTTAACWPTVASAFIFALMHFAHGPDWVPLFFFALGLGYLYRQTHRIVPAMVVHFLLNACSMLMLLVEIFL